MPDEPQDTVGTADTADSIKVGMRNNADDRKRVRAIRQAARQIDGLTLEMEPDDEDRTERPEMFMIPDGVASLGGAVKALGDGRVGGYLVQYGSPEQTDVSAAHDFFTPATDFDMSFPARSAVYFNHRLSAPLKGKLSHPADLRRDEFGVWAETVLDERDKYEGFLLGLAKKGKLGWSSGTASHLVERKNAGEANEITHWPLGLDASLTHMPAEPRNSVIPLKSFSDFLPPLELPETDEGESAPVVQPQDAGNIKTTINPSMEETMDTIQMSPEELQGLIKTAVTDAMKALPAPVAPSVTDVLDEADQPWAGPGEYFKAVKNAAFYPAKTDVRLSALKATGMSEGVPADGGYLLPQNMAAGVMSRVYDTNSILSRCANDVVSVGNSMTFNGVDESSHASTLYGGLIGYWGAEAGTLTSTKPTWFQLALKLKKIYALAYATDEQLEDTPFLEGWLTRTVPEVLRWFVEEAIVNGDGVGKPLGIMKSPCLVTSNRDTASAIKNTDIANMWSRRWRGANDYVWLIEGGASAQLHQMTAATAPVYMPAGNIAGSPFGTIYGRPVIETEHCQALNTTGDIILASLGQYQMISKGGVKAASSIHVAFTTDEQAFRFTYRIDGAPTWNSALTPAHGTSTVSPFVCLVSAST